MLVVQLVPTGPLALAAMVRRGLRAGLRQIQARLECSLCLRLRAALAEKAARERNAARMMLLVVLAGSRSHARAEVMVGAVATARANPDKINQVRKAASAAESQKVVARMAAPAAGVARECPLEKGAVTGAMVETPATLREQRPAPTVRHFAQVAVVAVLTGKQMLLVR